MKIIIEFNINDKDPDGRPRDSKNLDILSEVLRGALTGVINKLNSTWYTNKPILDIYGFKELPTGDSK